jgi:hypothetical protein
VPIVSEREIERTWLRAGSTRPHRRNAARKSACQARRRARPQRSSMTSMASHVFSTSNAQTKTNPMITQEMTSPVVMVELPSIALLLDNHNVHVKQGVTSLVWCSFATCSGNRRIPGR